MNFIETTTSEELIEEIAADMNTTYPQAKRLMRAFIKSLSKCITDRLEIGDKVVVSGLGAFSTKITQERKVRNVYDGSIVTIPTHVIVRFRPNDALVRRAQNAYIPDLEERLRA